MTLMETASVARGSISGLKRRLSVGVVVVVVLLAPFLFESLAVA